MKNKAQISIKRKLLKGKIFTLTKDKTGDNKIDRWLGLWLHVRDGDFRSEEVEKN